MYEICFQEIKLEGGWLMVKPVREDVGVAMKAVRNHKDKLYTLSIKERTKKRSLDANAKMWSLIRELSKVVNLPEMDIYQGYIPDIGDNYRIIPERPENISKLEKDWCSGHYGRMIDVMGPCKNLDGYYNVKCYRGSSELDTRAFSRLLDLIIQDCKQVGIETLSEREKSLLVEEWGKSLEK